MDSLGRMPSSGPCCQPAPSGLPLVSHLLPVLRARVLLPPSPPPEAMWGRLASPLPVQVLLFLLPAFSPSVRPPTSRLSATQARSANQGWGKVTPAACGSHPLPCSCLEKSESWNAPAFPFRAMRQSRARSRRWRADALGKPREDYPPPPPKPGLLLCPRPTYRESRAARAALPPNAPDTFLSHRRHPPPPR